MSDPDEHLRRVKDAFGSDETMTSPDLSRELTSDHGRDIAGGNERRCWRSGHNGPAQFDLAHGQPGFDGIAKPDLIHQQVANAISRDGPRWDPELVRQEDDAPLHGSQQDVPVPTSAVSLQHTRHLGPRLRTGTTACLAHAANAR
jgi:hypothetical protein